MIRRWAISGFLRSMALAGGGLILAGCAALQSAEDLLLDLAAGGGGPRIELPPAEKPVLREGDTFIYEGARVRQVASIVGNKVSWTDLTRDLYRTDPSFFVPLLHQRRPDRTITREVTGDPATLWPLAVGKRIEFTVDTTTAYDNDTPPVTSRRHWKCRVPRTHEVETPAGIYDAYRVECRSYRARWRNPVLVVTWEYAPAIGHFVVRDWRNQRTGTRNTYRLEAALPGELATPKRVRATLARLAKDG